MAPIPARRPPPPWPHESFRVGAALAASVSDLEEGCQGRGDLQGALRKSSYRSTQSPLHVPVPSLATKTVFPGGAADHYPIFSFSSVEATFRTLGQRFQRFSPLLAAPAALLLSQGQAKAVLTYNIFESAGNVVVETNGSIDLTGAVPMSPEVGAFYWTVPAPDIVTLGREEQGLVVDPGNRSSQYR